MRAILKTERFIIRQWELSDIEPLYKIMQDSKVNTYTSGGVWTKEKTENYVRYYANNDFQTLEQFHAACVLKESDELIGLTGLNPYLPKQPEFELKFGVPFWVKGYATEIGNAKMDKYF